MTKVNNRPSGYSSVIGKYHDLLTGKYGQEVTTPDGDREPWDTAPRGSLHLYQDQYGGRAYMKASSNSANNDWGVGIGVIEQTVSYDDFTDGGAAVGTLVLDAALPAGAYVLACNVLAVTGFAGDVSAALTVGDGTDVDRYNTGTPSVFATADFVSMGKVSGVPSHAAAMATITLTVTTNADFTSVSAGQLTVRLYYVI